MTPTTTTTGELIEQLYDLAGDECGDDFDSARFIAEVCTVLAARAGDPVREQCDGCDRAIDPEPLALAGFGPSTALDGNGDPDVSICALCIAEYHEEVRP